MIKRGLLMAREGVSMESLMDYEVEACLACVFTKERQESLKGFEERKGKASRPKDRKRSNTSCVKNL